MPRTIHTNRIKVHTILYEVYTTSSNYSSICRHTYHIFHSLSLNLIYHNIQHQSTVKNSSKQRQPPNYRPICENFCRIQDNLLNLSAPPPKSSKCLCKLPINTSQSKSKCRYISKPILTIFLLTSNKTHPSTQRSQTMPIIYTSTEGDKPTINIRLNIDMTKSQLPNA